MRFKPVYGVLLVLALSSVILFADYALDRGLSHGGFERVTPDRSGQVEIGIADFGQPEVRFYRFLNSGNQEVKFFVGRDEEGAVQVAFDANEICFKKGRGYRYQDGWLTCKWCDKSFRLSGVNSGGGGCQPVPLPFRRDGDRLIFTESDILAGWRFFR